MNPKGAWQFVMATTVAVQLAIASSNPPDLVTQRVSRLQYASPLLLTFQGAVLDARSQLTEPVVVHVFLKAKVLKTGSYLVRAVLYTQRTPLQGMTDNGEDTLLSVIALMCFFVCRRPRLCTRTSSSRLVFAMSKERQN